MHGRSLHVLPEGKWMNMCAMLVYMYMYGIYIYIYVWIHIHTSVCIHSVWAIHNAAQLPRTTKPLASIHTHMYPRAWHTYTFVSCKWTIGYIYTHVCTGRGLCIYIHMYMIYIYIYVLLHKTAASWAPKEESCPCCRRWPLDIYIYMHVHTCRGYIYIYI